MSLMGSFTFGLLLAAAQPAGETLEDQLQAAAELTERAFPMTQQSSGGPVTFLSMVARGRELTTTMQVAHDLDATDFPSQFTEALALEACGNPAVRALIDRGATVTYVVRDAEGDTFRASANAASC